jgi:dienelactone hydrolase
MRETACAMGDLGQLAGIVTEPDGPPRGAVILVSAGLVPKAGPYRLYAELARHLARLGFLTLRFDLGGIGDSRRGIPGEVLRARTALEIAAAVDHLTAAHGVSHVVLGGLCSGAEDSFRHAENDPRVEGVVLVDPFAYRTSGWTWRHLLHRAGRRSLRAAGVYEPPPRSAEHLAVGRRLVNYAYMERQESARILRALLARRAHVHFVYTGGMVEHFNHPGQLAAMFPGIDLGSRVTVDHLPHLDHTQALAEDRRELIEAIGRRLMGAARDQSRTSNVASTSSQTVLSAS